MSDMHPAVRPLPPQPSLEFERKAAKALLHELRERDPKVKLADAQLSIARGYGFASWPKLVRYFTAIERQALTPRSSHVEPPEMLEARVRSVLAEHRGGLDSAARGLAAYVPRFYGRPLAEVRAATMTEDEARLVHARRNGFPSWQRLLGAAHDHGSQDRSRERSRWERHPRELAHRAMEAGDLAELQRLVAQHPDLIDTRRSNIARGESLLGTALMVEERVGRAVVAPIVQWLATQGLDRQTELNQQLCGHMHMQADKVRRLLQLGADPNWIASNGIPVLEHAIIRYWSGEALDVLAARAVPRDGLWIAAGLDDVQAMGRCFDSRGHLRPEVRKMRPEFDVVGPLRMAAHPDASDQELLMEAALVAVLNDRGAAVDCLLSRGLDPDSLLMGGTLAYLAAGNGKVAALEALVRHGADLDLRGPDRTDSARNVAREMVVNSPDEPRFRRVAELCGLDHAGVLTHHDAEHPAPPPLGKRLERVLMDAADDARRQGSQLVTPEHLVFGLLRGVGQILFARLSGLDLERFSAVYASRLKVEGTEGTPATESSLALDAESQGFVDSARALAKRYRRMETTEGQLLRAMLEDDDGVAAGLIREFGGRVEPVRKELDKGF